MYRLLISFILVTSSLSALAQQQPFNVVEQMFVALSEGDKKLMKELVTDDFELLEVGEVWDLEKTLSIVEPSTYLRRNYFSVITTKDHGESVWISYWNKATFTKGEEKEEVQWLESAVMVKVDGKWKCEMLHSTRLNPKQYPTDVNYVEFVHK